MNFQFFNNIYFWVVLTSISIIITLRTLIKKKGTTKSRKGDYNTPIGDVDYLQEIVLTMSNRSSLLSSKKIERFVVFLTFLVVTIIFISKKIDNLTTTEFLEILTVWLGYGGYNSFMNYRDKKLENNQPVLSTQEPTPDETSVGSQSLPGEEEEVK